MKVIKFDIFYLAFAIVMGMLMLPKTVCYMILIWAFWKYIKGNRDAG